MSLLVEEYTKLPPRRPQDDPDLWQAGADAALKRFRHAVGERYSEGTLARILSAHEDPLARRAAAVALGQIGTMASNTAVAAALHDADDDVRQLASAALWDLWFRGDSPEQWRALRLAMGLTDTAQRLAACDELIREWPHFAEAVNQRAVLHFNRGQYSRAVADCEAALRLNPYHFGAAAGMGQCYLRMNKPRKALRAFAQAVEINPSLTDLHDMIATLRDTLGGE